MRLLPAALGTGLGAVVLYVGLWMAWPPLALIVLGAAIMGLSATLIDIPSDDEEDDAA